MFNLVLSALLQLSFFMLAEAAPISAQSAKPWQAGTGGGIVGFIVLVLDIIAWSMSYLIAAEAAVQRKWYHGAYADVFVPQLKSSSRTALSPTKSSGL